MAALRTAVSMLALYDRQAQDMSPEANEAKALKLMAQTATIVTSMHRLRSGNAVIPGDPQMGFAENFLYTLNGKKPDHVMQRAFDVALVLHAEHELNASTFAARVTAATLSDIYSSVTSAIGALKGPLHGGANERVMELLGEIGTVDRAEEVVKAKLARHERVMGFGHRVYKVEDPRATILRDWSRRLGEAKGDLHYYALLRELEQVVFREKGLYPNVDLYSGSVYALLGIPTDLFTPIFAASRVAGWTAHVLEEYQDLRLIRPTARYIGAVDLPYVPIGQRG